MKETCLYAKICERPNWSWKLPKTAPAVWTSLQPTVLRCTTTLDNAFVTEPLQHISSHAQNTAHAIVCPEPISSSSRSSLNHSSATPRTMSGAVPKTFWSSPIRYLRWASHEKPAIFYSILLGALGPVSLFVIPPLRRMAGDEDPPKIPLTYPGELHDRTSYSRSLGCIAGS
jgi:hypothetical protein